MNYKKSILAIACMALLGIAPAQARGGISAKENKAVNYDSNTKDRWHTDRVPSYFGVRLGMNIPQLFVNTSADINTKTNVGLSLGVIAGQRLAPEIPLYIELGLFYMNKGYKSDPYTYTYGTTTATGYVPFPNYPGQEMSIRMHNLEIPLVFKYKADIGVDDLTIDPFLGGFFSFGLGGKMKYYEDARTYTNPVSGASIPFPRKELKTYRTDGLKRFDAGLRVGCGVTYQMFYGELSYEIGLVNVARENLAAYDYDHFNDKLHTGNFNISIGVEF